MTNTQQQMLGSKAQALANAKRLLRHGQHKEAAEQAREVIRGDDRDAEAFRLLGMALRAAGDLEDAKQAEDKSIVLSSLHPNIFQATMALAENRLDAAERLLRAHLKDQPDDAATLRLLAEIGARMAQFDAAENLLVQALVVAPEFTAARRLLDRVRLGRDRSTASREGQFQRPAPSADTDATDHYAEALQLYEKVVELYPDSPENWASYGHVLRTVGQ